MISSIFYLLVISVFLSPRLSMGGQSKSIDLRLEDLILFVFILLCFFKSLSSTTINIKFPYVFLAIICLSFVAIITSIAGEIYFEVGLYRLMYLFKQLEYYVFFILIILFIDKLNIQKFDQIMMMCIFFNILWFVYQVLSGQWVGLQNGYYGIGAIADYSSFASAIIFASLCLYSFDKFMNNPYFSYFYLFSSFILYFATLMTFSRSVFVTLSLYLILYMTFRKTKVIFLSLMLFVPVFILFLNYIDINLLDYRVLNYSSFYNSFEQRIENYFIMLFEKFDFFNFFLGFGNGMWGSYGFPVEAHNYYLRIIVDNGIFGLILFIIMIFLILNYYLRLNFMRFTNLGLLFIAIISSFVQDVFISHKFNFILIVFFAYSFYQSRRLANYES